VISAVVVLAAVGFGLTPALHAARVDLRTALRAAPRGASVRGRGWPDALVTLQVALAMLLLVGAFLMTGSFTRLSAVDPGFDPRGVMTVPVSLPPNAYGETARVTFFREATSRLAALPGVRGVAATATNPFRQWGYANDVTPEERAADAPPSGLLMAGWRSVTPGFFSTLGIPLVVGRDFTDADDDGALPVAVISRGLAERLWPGRNAVGRRFYWGGLDGTPRTVIGVAGDIRDAHLDGDVTPLVYVPYEQLPLEGMTLLVRTQPGVTGVPAAVRYELHAIDPNLPVTEVQPLEANRVAAIATPRLRAMLLSAFGAAALLLACIGLYGVIAFTIAQRTREIGIRVALGARPTQVVGVFFRHGVRLIAVGGIAGLASAWWLARFLRALLFQTDARDPALFAMAAGLLALVAALATYLPARRAARLDPVAAIGHEQI
jgi:putative ABC transport system permease protein